MVEAHLRPTTHMDVRHTREELHRLPISLGAVESTVRKLLTHREGLWQLSMEVRPQKTDVDVLVRNVEAAGVSIPLAPYTQANRLHHLASLLHGIPVRPQLPVVNEPEASPS